MSAPPNFTNFAFQCGQGVLSDWTEAHACSLYDSILADPIQCTKNTWTPTHIRWMMKSIWFCDKTAWLSRVTGIDASVLRRQQATVFRQIHPFVHQFCHPSIQENAVRSPSFHQDLSNIVGEFWLATSDPMSSDVETGPSDGEGNEDKDVGYGAAQQPASPIEVDPAGPEGEPSGDKTGEEWWIVYGTSSDNGSGEEEEEVEEEVEQKRKSLAERKEDIDHDTDDEREEEEEVDELKGGGASDAAPALKKKGYTRTSWLVDLNQHLRQGKTQLAMCAYMVEMEEEGLLEPADEKCSQCRGGCHCLLPVDSDNGHPTCAECLISSHGCPNCVARSAPARKKLTHLSKGKAKPEAGPSTMPTVLDFMVEFQSFCSRPMQERPTPGHDPVTNFTFNLAERCLGGLTHPGRQHGIASLPSCTSSLWLTRSLNSMLSADEEHREGSAEGKGDT
ncbi:hypothetical protein ARMGADRAFT_1088753 [Armillaria gallica]|uniref:Uncharacterized protein n=1 Tax=Armillaria gallica TaxID=47427 RepID=A0A2H3D4S1_ARMGA|nr:hypothetical protein ARMGADRAFT_1088753 [Armillaria gallica]